MASDIVVDSSVVAKWILTESDSALAFQLVTDISNRGGHLHVLDLGIIETANAVRNAQHRKLMSEADARVRIAKLLAMSFQIEPAFNRLAMAAEFAIKYSTSVYDALFVALAHELSIQGVTADVPLYKRVSKDFPEIILLQDWK